MMHTNNLDKVNYYLYKSLAKKLKILLARLIFVLLILFYSFVQVDHFNGIGGIGEA